MSGWLAPSSSLAGPRSPPCWPPAGAASLAHNALTSLYHLANTYSLKSGSGVSSSLKPSLMPPKEHAGVPSPPPFLDSKLSPATFCVTLGKLLLSASVLPTVKWD